MVFIIISFLIIVGLLWFDSQNRIIPRQISKIKKSIADKDYETAHTLLNLLPEEKKKAKSILLLYYDLYKNEKQYFLAIYELEKILNLKENTVAEKIDYYLKKAELFNLLNKFKHAYNDYEKVIELDEENFEANFKMGEYLFKLNYFSTAKNYLNKALNASKDNVQVREMLLSILIEEEKYLEAKEKIKKLIEEIKAQGGVILCRMQYNFALVEYFLNKPERALLIIEKIHPSYHSNPELNLLKALCLYELNEADTGETIFSTFLSKNIDNYSNIYLLARYKYTELLFYKKQISLAQQQTLFLDGYKQGYRDNKKRKFIFSELDSLGLRESFFIKELPQLQDKNFIFKDNPYSFAASYKINEYTFIYLAKETAKTYTALLYYLDMKELEINIYLGLIKKIEDYLPQLKKITAYTFLPINFEMKKQLNKNIAIEIIAAVAFFKYIKKLFQPAT